MTKQIFSALLFIFSFSIGKAQDHLLAYGINAGINFNNARGNALNKEFADNLKGYAFGGLVKMNLTNKFGVKLQLQYEQNGWAYRGLIFENSTGTGLVKGDILYKLNYLNLPVSAEYSFGNKTIFNLNAGLFFGFLLNGKTIVKEPTMSGIITHTTTAKTKTTNNGITVGAGMQIPITTSIKLGIGLQDNLGLKNINPSSGLLQSSIRTNSFLIHTGLTFIL